eukprot:CAMPEP_0178419790 /NCGR_PEP_ID=MMETSP0689_2-20121128/25793_1 /TAXON_ID=160604 /ORGANISM="Amphidinium massartii, Strain CS-259" /LENGTH=176 /DNA_ID=CAMNT_0020041241 /DNA_START=41 /DNA_END=568 /DNA_ORIENTATION=-
MSSRTLVVVLAAIAGNAFALDDPLDYKSQVAAMKDLMEAGRHHDAGNVAVMAAAPQVHAQDDNIDIMLMSTADRIAEEMQVRSSQNQKKKALLSSKTEVTRGSAARFFAKNGMDKVAQLLGHKNEELAAHKKSAAKVTAAAVATQQYKSVDELLAEDNKSSQNTWKAVDALRRHRP